MLDLDLLCPTFAVTNQIARKITLGSALLSPCVPLRHLPGGDHPCHPRLVVLWLAVHDFVRVIKGYPDSFLNIHKVVINIMFVFGKKCLLCVERELSQLMFDIWFVIWLHCKPVSQGEADCSPFSVILSYHNKQHTGQLLFSPRPARQASTENISLLKMKIFHFLQIKIYNFLNWKYFKCGVELLAA